MKKKTMRQAVSDFRSLIVQVRGIPVILDSDLAKAYGVTTGALNQAVKRNRERFPEEFVFVVDPQEVAILKAQIVTSSYTTMLSQTVTASSKRNARRPPSAFTEHGAIMAAMVLSSPQAVQMSVFVVQAFVAMRSMLLKQGDLAKKLVDLERTLTERLDTHEHAISDIIQQIMLLLSPPQDSEPEEPVHPRIGFTARERCVCYRVQRAKKTS